MDGRNDNPQPGDSIIYVEADSDENYPAIVTALNGDGTIGVMVWIGDATLKNGKAYGNNPPPGPPGGPGHG